MLCFFKPLTTVSVSNHNRHTNANLLNLTSVCLMRKCTKTQETKISHHLYPRKRRTTKRNRLLPWNGFLKGFVLIGQEIELKRLLVIVQREVQFCPFDMRWNTAAIAMELLVAESLRMETSETEEKQRYAISFSVWLVGKQKTEDFLGTTIEQTKKCINFRWDLEEFSYEN